MDTRNYTKKHALILWIIDDIVQSKIMVYNNMSYYTKTLKKFSLWDPNKRWAWCYVFSTLESRGGKMAEFQVSQASEHYLGALIWRDYCKI